MRYLVILLKILAVIWGISFVVAMVFGGGKRLRKACDDARRADRLAREFRSFADGSCRDLHVVEGLLLPPVKVHGKFYHHLVLPHALVGEGRVLTVHLPVDGAGTIEVVEAAGIPEETPVGKTWVVLDLHDGTPSPSSDVAFHVRTRKKGERDDPLAVVEEKLGLPRPETVEGQVLVGVLHLSWGLDGTRVGANYAHWERDASGPVVTAASTLHVDDFACFIDVKRKVRARLGGTLAIARAAVLDFLTLPYDALRIIGVLLGGPGVV